MHIVVGSPQPKHLVLTNVAAQSNKSLVGLSKYVGYFYITYNNDSQSLFKLYLDKLMLAKSSWSLILYITESGHNAVINPGLTASKYGLQNESSPFIRSYIKKVTWIKKSLSMLAVNSSL